MGDIQPQSTYFEFCHKLKISIFAARIENVGIPPSPLPEGGARPGKGFIDLKPFFVFRIWKQFAHTIVRILVLM